MSYTRAGNQAKVLSHGIPQFVHRAAVFTGKAVFTTDCFVPDRTTAAFIPRIDRRLAAATARDIIVPPQLPRV